MQKLPNHGYRNIKNLIYRLIKGYKHRAQTFYLNAESFEEREAWKKVIDWFDSILSHKHLLKSGAIGVPKSAIREAIEKEGFTKQT